jgi:hypothetical protein
MTWLKENRFLAALVAATIALGAAAVFLMTQSMAEYHEAVDAYSIAVQKLHALQDRSPFPNAQNLEKNRALVEQYKAQLDTLRAQVQKMQTPAPAEVQPQKFQDDLRSAVSRVEEKAQNVGVELPKGFYLGFSQYANSLPSEAAAPRLALQLRIIEKIVTSLIDFKVQSIDTLNRLPLPEESGIVAGGLKPAEAKQPDSQPKGFEALPFDLAFTAEQGKVRVAFNSLLDSDQFLIVRNLAMQNTARVGPPVSRESATGIPPKAPAAAAVPGANTGGAATARGVPSANELDVILGRELVKASLRVEIIDFSKLSEASK